MAFGLVSPGMMSVMASGFAAFAAAGTGDEFVALRVKARLPSRGIEFPGASVVASVGRRGARLVAVED